MNSFFRITTSVLFILVAVAMQANAIVNSEKNSQGMQFIENKGQIADMNNKVRPEILYVGNGKGMQVYLRKGGISYVLNSQSDPLGLLRKGLLTEESEVGSREDQSQNEQDIGTINLHRIDLDFLNSNPNAAVLNSEQVEGYFNYYLGHCPDGITNVHAYNKIEYQNIYPNIDIIFYGSTSLTAGGGKESGLKYDIIVRPGGNPDDVKIKYTGGRELRIESASGGGELRIIHSLGEMIENIPKVYQNINGKTIDVIGKYQLEGTTLNFKLSNYQTNYPLIIDPWVTYYGGTGDEEAYGVAVDNLGNVLISGTTRSLNFPVTPGALQSVHGNGAAINDGYAVKFDPNGARLWATYFGGNGGDRCHDITSDINNNAIAVGGTSSTNFPVSAGAFQTSVNGQNDAFAIKFDPNGLRIWATFLGGGGPSGQDSDGAYGGVDTDASGNVVLVGYTTSASFPGVIPGVAQTTCPSCTAGSADAFISKLDVNGFPLWSTYYGGSADYEEAISIAVDKTSGNIAVSGVTYSSNFSVSAGAFQNTLQGTTDAFILALNPSGGRLWASYYGGTANDIGQGIDFDGSGNVIMGGYTNSSDLPVTTGAYQTAYAGTSNPFPFGPGDGFLTKFSSTGVIAWATYIGGTSSDNVAGVCTEKATDIIHLNGTTYSTDFPVTTCANQTVLKGSGALAADNFIMRFTPGGLLDCSGYMGGNSYDADGYGNTIATDGTYIYTTGMTISNDYPVTKGAYDTSYNGSGYDAFATKLCAGACGLNPITPDFIAANTQLCAGNTTSFTDQTTITGTCNATSTQWLWTFTGATPSSSTVQNPSGIVYPSAGNYPVKLIVSNSCNSDSIEKINYMTIFPASAVSITGNTNICAGSTTVLSTSNTGNYSWSTGSTNSSITLSPTSTDTYTLTVSNGSCSGDTTVTVTVNNLPSVIGSSAQNVCAGSSVTLTAGGAQSYTWSPATGLSSTTGNSVNATPSAPTSYTVIGNDLNGCSNTISIAVAIDPSPSVTLSGNMAICEGATTNISVSGGNSYTWSSGETVSSINVSLTSNATYTVSVTGLNGCTKDTSVTISVSSAPTPDAGPNDTLCAGESISITATGGSNYSWNTGESTSSITISPSTSSQYTVTISNGGCSGTDSVTITVNNSPTALAETDTTILQGQSILLNGSGGGTYLWTPSTGLSCNTCQNPIASPQETTTYYLTVMDANGCTSMDTVTITVDILCGDLFIPNAFSPNNDGQNDVFQIQGNCIKEMAFIIYHRWGQVVFESNDISETWDGTNQRGSGKGVLMDTAVFAYQLTVVFTNSETVTKKGNISLIR